MFDQVVRDKDLQLVLKLPGELVSQFYLAGGTGLALQIGHRYSLDFDFFSDNEFNNERLKQELSKLGKFPENNRANTTTYTEIIELAIAFLIVPVEFGL